MTRTRISSSSIPEPIADYMRMVDNWEVIACDEQHSLMAFLKWTFDHEEIYFDGEQFEKYMSYQKYFPYDLFPWERFVFALHNCTYSADGTPRFPDLLLLLGRGAGKNGYISFEDFCLVTETNGIRNYDIDISANSEEQAMTSFNEIHDVLENPKYSKVLAHNFDWNKTVITNKKTGSRIRYRTSNAKTKDGGRQGKVDFDEIHAYENWDSLNVFLTGLGKKPHPRTTYATTDGDVRDGPLDQLKKRADQILRGKIRDNGLLPFVCKLDKEDEVHDEANWVKANPSLPYRHDLMQRIRTEYQNYILEPVKNSAFMTKRMNIPKGKADVQVTSWENIMKTNRPLPDLTGKTCVCGIDYSKTTDFMSAVLLFRGEDEYYAIHHSWFCTASKDKGRIKIPLDEMERRGLLTIVDDVEISARLVAEWIMEQRRNYNVLKIACDSYRFSILSRALDEIGYSAKKKEVKLVRPSDIMQAQIKIASAFARGAIIWGDDPLMRWYTNNTKLEPAPNDNFKYGKIEPFSRKTDGFMAFAHAMTLEDELPEESKAAFMEPIIF